MYRRFRTPTRWQEMDHLQREMNRLFESVYGEGNRVVSGYPAMNIWTNPESAVVTTELPGVSPENIDISIVGETLTLTGERQPEQLPEGARYHRQERGYGKFTRSVQLPFQVDAEKVDARFEKGVLHISLPRAEADKPKKIQVKAATP
jgi:HSP20 family protein